VPWRNTFFYLENSASTQTVGVGTSYQSRDPYYELTLGLRPRLYLAASETYELSLRADLGVTTERTNSDTTTEEGEWSATDFELVGAFAYELRKSASRASPCRPPR
jgi:outer membrane lipopolysaccharide assembly protein LptE/RlpB